MGGASPANPARGHTKTVGGTGPASHLGRLPPLRGGAGQVASHPTRAPHRPVWNRVVRGGVRAAVGDGAAGLSAVVAVRQLPPATVQRTARPDDRGPEGGMVAHDRRRRAVRPAPGDVDGPALGRRRQGPARARRRVASVLQVAARFPRRVRGRALAPDAVRGVVGSDARRRRTGPRAPAPGRHLAAVRAVREGPDVVAARMPPIGANPHRRRVKRPRQGRKLSRKVHLKGSGSRRIQ